MSPLAAAVMPAELRAAFVNEGWRIRDPSQAAPSVSRFLDQTSLFLTLVGLTSLLVGGIGVANGVGAWLDARGRTIATLRCLGASSGLVLAICLIQVLSLAVLGIILGLAVGATVPVAVAFLPEGWLPVPPAIGLYPGPLLLAACFGLLTALCFALWPLGRAARIPGAALFRDLIVPEHTRPHAWVIAVNALVAAALVAVTIAAAVDRRFAMYFCVAALATLAVVVQVPNEGEFLFIGATAAWRLSAEAARERQAVAITDLDARHRCDLPTVIAGDFNANPDTASIRYLTGRQSLGGRSVLYHDAWAIAGEGPGYTWTVENPKASAVVDQIVKQPANRSRFDYVFVGSWDAHPKAHARVLDARLAFDQPIDGIWASDHFGVVVDLEIGRDDL